MALWDNCIALPIPCGGPSWGEYVVAPSWGEYCSGRHNSAAEGLEEGDARFVRRAHGSNDAIGARKATLC